MVFFVDELYFYDRNQNCFISKFSAGSFLKLLSAELNIEAIFSFPARSGQCITSYSTRIDGFKYHIESLPAWDSIFSYYKYLFNAQNFISLKKKVTNIANKGDILWIRLPSPFGLWLGKEAEKRGKFVIYHVAGDVRYGYLSPKYKGILRLLAKAIGNYLHKKSFGLGNNGVFLCTGSKLLNFYKSTGKRAIYFIDSLISSENLKMPKIELNYPVKMLYVGRILEEKGVFFLLDAIEEIRDEYNVELNIVGFGRDENKLKEKIQDKRYIRFHGFIGNNSDLHNIYSENNIFVLPSLSFYEGFPRVIVEAWANGLFVISSRVGGIEGLGKDGENLMFFKAGDEDDFMKKVRLIIENGELRNKLAKGVREVQEVITFEYSVSIIKNIINEI